MKLFSAQAPIRQRGTNFCSIASSKAPSSECGLKLGPTRDFHEVCLSLKKTKLEKL